MAQPNQMSVDTETRMLRWPTEVWQRSEVWGAEKIGRAHV